MVPQSRTPIVLLTRPAAQSARFAATLQARFGPLRIITSPLIAPRFLTPALPGRPWSALILTSETAVQSAQRIIADGGHLPPLAFCVGDHTADAARAIDLNPVSAQGDAAALIALILSQQPKGPLLHLQARDTRGDFTATLNSAGIETHSAVTYSQETQPLTPQATHILTGQDPLLIPLFSPRTASHFAAECHRIGATAPMTLVMMSGAIAKAAASLSANPLIAARTDAEAMLDALTTCMADAGKP